MAVQPTLFFVGAAGRKVLAGVRELFFFSCLFEIAGNLNLSSLTIAGHWLYKVSEILMLRHTAAADNLHAITVSEGVRANVTLSDVSSSGRGVSLDANRGRFK